MIRNQNKYYLMNTLNGDKRTSKACLTLILPIARSTSRHISCVDEVMQVMDE